MRNIFGSILGILALLFGSSAFALGASPNLSYNNRAGLSAKGNCPIAGCVTQRPSLTNATERGVGTCSYTRVSATDRQRHYYGVVLHTSEGSAKALANQAQDKQNCVSWNYSISPNGKLISSVPLNAVAYDASNRWYNTNYVQVEIIGHAGLCDLTPQQYNSLGKLTRYLSDRFGFTPSAANIFGHDSVPGINGDYQGSQHWDPGLCIDWKRIRDDAGARLAKAVPSAALVAINPRFKQNQQTLSDCTDGSECNPAKANRVGLNFLPVYSAPSTNAPLASDPYFHSDGRAGTTAMNDWSSKAVSGQRFVVAQHRNGWIGVWFGGRLGWLQDTGKTLKGVHGRIVLPRHDHVTVFGRPLPSPAEYKAAMRQAGVSASGVRTLFKAQYVPAKLSKYSLRRGQAYAMVPVGVPNEFYAGCDGVACKQPGDGVIVRGKERYLEIWYNHRFAFVRASDVIVRRK